MFMFAGMRLTDNIEIQPDRTAKIARIAFSLQGKLVRWYLFLLDLTREKRAELAMNEPVIKKALATWDF